MSFLDRASRMFRAASFVKVRIVISSGGVFSSWMRCFVRCASCHVLPVPGPASRRIGPGFSLYDSAGLAISIIDFLDVNITCLGLNGKYLCFLWFLV